MSFFSRFFKQSTANIESTSFTIQLKRFMPPNLDFSRFMTGIDNVHIDVHLSSHFISLTQRLVHDLLDERTTSKRRFSDKPSKNVRMQFDEFINSYASMLKAAIHRAKEGKRLDKVRLLQVAVVKFILELIHTETDQLLYQLRDSMMSNGGHSQDKKNFNAYERTVWITKNQTLLLHQLAYEIFSQLHWIESGTIGRLRASLLGEHWSIPEAMLFNALLRTPKINDAELLMQNYVFLSDNPNSDYDFSSVDNNIDKILDDLVQCCPIEIESIETEKASTSLVNFSWKDMPENMTTLFDVNATKKTLRETPEQKNKLEEKIKSQTHILNMLVQELKQTNLMLHILAAYETPKLYEHYAKLLKPCHIYEGLCGAMSIQDVMFKLDNQLKIRPLRRPDDKPLTINELSNAKKRLQSMAKKPPHDILARFMYDFITYRRDLKYHHLMQKSLEEINVLTDEANVQLSRSNSMLNEFLEESEYKIDPDDAIRGHVILKADIRGSTTITNELRKRNLNPATHFSLNFFNPIRDFIEKFGAEKVFIEGDAIIFSIFEYQTVPDQWLATTRACGLAKSILTVVESQNQVCRKHGLPVLELGIGICYETEAPTFLYYGDQRIMISPAIGDADRLSSCTWRLRHYYKNKPLLTNVMVFKHSENDPKKGEKGMTTFRYNVNGIELDVRAFKKLKSEIALQQIVIRLPDENSPSRFYIGKYQDVKGGTHNVVVREAAIKLWKENNQPHTNLKTPYYEVVTNKKILNTIKKRLHWQS